MSRYETLRNIRDLRNRKKVTGGVMWTDRLMEELNNSKAGSSEVNNDDKKSK